MKALIFDLDGVVADTASAHYRSWQRLAAEEGVPFNIARHRELLGRTREDSMDAFARDLTLGKGQRADWLARKQAYFLEELAAMGPADILPGVEALIAEARAAGLAVGLASSSRNARAVLERLGLTQAFDVIADGATVARPKPAPDIFLWVADALRCRPAQALVFEDSDAGVAAAVAGGFPVVGLGPDAPPATINRSSLAGARLIEIYTALGTPSDALG